MYIAMYTYVQDSPGWAFRYNFLERSLETFLKTDFPENTHIVISDDNSKDKRVKKLLCGIQEPKNTTIEFIFRDQRAGCDRNMVSTMRHCFSKTNDRFIITCDSDVLYNPQWVRKLIESKESMPKDAKIGMLTCFDTKSHKVIRSINDFVNEKKTVGGFCAFVNRDILMDPKLNLETWDWSFCAISKDKGYKFYCTKLSYVEHMGKGKSGEGKSWDVARNFVGLENGI